MNDYKKYLPSKKFVSVIVFVIIVIILFFSMKALISFIFTKKTKVNSPVVVTISDKAQKDSNNNGIPDWEEYLYGLDPYKNGSNNKEFIYEKRQTLAQNNNKAVMDDSVKISDNEALSRGFFAAIVSLQQTGDLSAENIASVSEAIGKNVVPTEIKDIYTADMQTTVAVTPETYATYYDKLSVLVNKYIDSDIGNEITIIVEGLNKKDPQALYAAKTIAVSYQSFGKELLAIPVPKSIAATSLSAANNYEKTGLSIIELTSVLNDPIAGMKAILNYKKYNDELGTNLEKISELLQ